MTKNENKSQKHFDLSDDKAKEKAHNTIKSAAIMLAVELDSAFRLYSYRIINDSDYLARVNDLVDFYMRERTQHTSTLKVDKDE